MHPFPPTEDLPNLVGDEIIQIWLDPHAVRLLFGAGVQLYVEEAYELTEPGGTPWTYDFGEAGPVFLLQRHLYQPIVTLKREDFRLTLSMEDGAKLAIVSNRGQYECGHFQWPDGKIQVF